MSFGVMPAREPAPAYAAKPLSVRAEQPRRIGAITIGQSPRADVIPEMAPFLGEAVEIIERGLLDGRSAPEIQAMKPPPGEAVLVSRLRDGTEVSISARWAREALPATIAELEALGCYLIVVLCTGEFPGLSSRVPLVLPQRLLFHTVSALARELHLGVIVPSPLQIPGATARWGPAAARVTAVSGSPYGEARELDAAARSLAVDGVDIVVLDCMGHAMRHRALVQGLVGRPVVLARTLVARVLGELLGAAPAR
ncbi:MAG TPA: AroM family protein [Bacillota bacterium]|nr:AroM family protein [Bacillota bacterium]